jgi:hypothetical protein
MTAMAAAARISMRLVIVRFFTSCIALVAAAAPTFAQSPPRSPELAKIVADAKQEGKVLLHITAGQIGSAIGAKAAQDGINKMFGTDIAVDWSPGPSFGPLAAEIYQAMQAGQPASSDVYLGTPQQIVPFLDRGLFRTVDWRGLMPDRIVREMVEADNRALRLVTLLPAILYNVKAAPWVAQVDTLADLLKPEYKGKFATTPFLAGFDVLIAADMWGQQKTEDYVRKLATQVSGVLDCSSVDRIASGEIPALAIDCAGKDDNIPKYRGKNILGTRILSDMAERRYTYMLIPTNAAHPNAATLFTLYMLSKEGQENWLLEYWGSDLTDFPSSLSEKKISGLEAKGVKFTDVTIDWWRSHPGIDKSVAALSKIVNEQH